MIVIDEVVQNGILHGFKHLARNKTKKKNTFVFGNAGEEKFFLINLIKLFSIKFLLKKLLSHFSLLKNKESYLLLFKEKITLILPNKFASGKPP